MRRVLIFYPRRVGDWVVLTPLLRSLRNGYPTAEIVAVGSFRSAGVMPLLPYCDRFSLLDRPQKVLSHARLLMEVLGRSWDLLIDPNASFSRTSGIFCRLTRGRVKLAFHRQRGDAAFTQLVEGPQPDEHMLAMYGRLAKALGLSYDPVPELRLLQGELERTRGELKALGLTKRFKILIHPGNPRRVSSLWPFENFAALAKRLKKDFDVFFLAGLGEKEDVVRLAREVDPERPIVVGAGPLAQDAAYIKEADLFVSSNTGTSQVAAAIGTATFTFHTGYTWKVWRMPGERHAGLAGERDDCRGIPVEDAYQGILRHIESLRTSQAKTN